MNSRSTWLMLPAMAAALLAVGAGPSVPPSRAPEARAVPGSPSVPERAPVALVPPSIAPAPTVASGAAVSQDPRPSSGTSGNAAGPGDKYEVPVGLAPVTNRSTCRHAPRDCCDDTKEWCLAEGFVWQSCKNCYCGSQCMAPALFKD